MPRGWFVCSPSRIHRRPWPAEAPPQRRPRSRSRRIFLQGKGSMAAKYILAALAVVFLIAAALRGFRGPQAGTWLLVAGIFIAVSLWLFARA